jgi:TRAP-type uncharacterized transport system fused permease subunit
MLAVFWATVVTFAVSWLRRDTAIGLAQSRRRAARRLRPDAERGRHLCRPPGIIVGVVAKTGLGLKFSAIVIAYAGGSLI